MAHAPISRLETYTSRRATSSFAVADFLEEIEIGASRLAQSRNQRFVITRINATVEGDGKILAAAVSNPLQNAFEFSRKEGTIALTARATDDRATTGHDRVTVGRCLAVRS